jgi:hypothetical protein
MAAERRGPAALDSAHHLVLRPGDARSAAFDKARTEGTENVSDL